MEGTHLFKKIENRIDTIFVHVTDLNRSIHWYTELLGLEVREGNHAEPVYTLNMGHGRPGITLDNHCFEEDYNFIPSNQPLFNLSASNINEAYNHVKEMGAEIITE